MPGAASAVRSIPGGAPNATKGPVAEKKTREREVFIPSARVSGIITNSLCCFLVVQSDGKCISVLKKGWFVRRLSIITLSALVCIGASSTRSRAEANAPQKSLHEAARDGDIEQLKRLIGNGSNVNEVDDYGWTPLRSAIEAGQTEAARTLVEAGANVNGKDRDGLTPLIRACLGGYKEITELLVAKGADLAAKDDYQRMALHAAVMMGRLEIVEVLLKGGADVNLQDGRGQTPLVIARQRGATEIADLLVKHGAKEPALSLDPYGDYGPGQGMSQTPGGTYGVPQPPAVTEVKIDPNEVMAMMQKFEGVVTAMQELEKKSETEQRVWAQRRMDNRTMLLRAVDKQFEDEMTFLRKTAQEEKAEESVKTVDDLTAKRKSRSKLIGEALMDQRREMLQSRTSGQGTDLYGRGGHTRTSTRAGRGQYLNTGQTGSTAGDPYGVPTTGRTPVRRTMGDVNEPVIDPETQAQIQAWLNAKPDDRKGLLDAVYGRDLADLSTLEQVAAEEEKAEKTGVVIMALMLARQERAAKIVQKWQEDDERMMRLQQRYGQPGPRARPRTR